MIITSLLYFYLGFLNIQCNRLHIFHLNRIICKFIYVYIIENIYHYFQYSDYTVRLIAVSNIFLKQFIPKYLSNCPKNFNIFPPYGIACFEF